MTIIQYFVTWIEPDGTIFDMHSGDLVAYPIYQDIEAIGSQVAFAMAMGAMRAGASAEEAVAICIKYCSDAAGEVRSMKLEELPKPTI